MKKKPKKEEGVWITVPWREGGFASLTKLEERKEYKLEKYELWKMKFIRFYPYKQI